jgi:acyl carrier protein
MDERLRGILGDFDDKEKLANLGDSLDYLQLIVDIEKELEIDISTEDATRCETVGDLVNLVEHSDHVPE